jgi:DNA ligase-associated metallophosphoesterase
MHISTTIANEELWLLPQKVLFWPKRSMLIIADAHLGKASHFRKNGIALPREIALGDLATLNSLITRLAPNSVLFLGDLFHSAPNQEWEWFASWMEQHAGITFILVQGNHDAYLPNHYIQHHLRVVNQVRIGPFLFTHEPLEEPSKDFYNLCGHIHPGVRLRGKGRQYAKLPCFWFGEQQGILPAFGNLTGAVSLRGKAQVFGIADNQVFAF